jgi:hypothetical protein
MRANTARTAEFLDSTPATLRTWRCNGYGPPYYKAADGSVTYDLKMVAKWLRDRRRERSRERLIVPGQVVTE